MSEFNQATQAQILSAFKLEIQSLRQQLAASQKREVMLRDVLTKISNRFDYGPTYGSIEWTTLNDAVNAITATEADLDGFVLCEREPVGKTYRDFLGTKLELSRTLIPGEFLYRAAQKEQVE